jgi:hypothetical protein
MGVSTHRPSSQYQRPRRKIHSPSTQASARAGLLGICSIRPGGGGISMDVSAAVDWGTYRG